MVNTIKLASIVRNSTVARTVDKESEKYQILKGLIKAEGLRNLFTVYDNEDGTYTLGDGDHRFTALCDLRDEGGSDEVICNVKTKLDDIEILRLQVSGNASVTQTTNKEYIEALHRLVTAKNSKGLDQLAKDVGMTKSYLLKLFKTKKLSERILEEADALGVKIGNIMTLSDLAGVISEDEIIDEFLPQAAEQKIEDFGVTVVNKLDSIRAAKAGIPKSTEFVAKEKMKSKDEVKLRIARETDEVILETLKWVISTDEKSVIEQKQEYDRAKAIRAKAAEDRKTKKALENYEELKQKLEAAQAI